MDSNNLIQSRRSFIFTPGLKPEMFLKAIISGSDMVCVELEDGIAPQDKDLARKLAIKLFETKQNNDGIERILRINSLREKFGIDDVQAILNTNTPPPALMIPKVKSSEEIVLLDSLLTEKRHNCRLHIIIETNEGLEKAYDIANCSNRIDSLFFGGVDMSAELRCENKWEPLLYARSRIVHAASSAGIDAIDVPFLDLDDPEGMKKEAIKAKQLGFSGKGSIHPKQIPILNEVFTPSEEVIQRAKKITSTFEKANTGLVVIEGKLIEKPVLREMYRILAVAKKIEKNNLI
ncbi:CoA ester lyase [Alphaproteobacteria bacterium]|nr:CoA ester lyase [Alphaproteobacteria bacterium]